jgi:site-specific recombinase XerD
LRVSEVVHIKLTDIHRKSMQIRIEQSKGRKDRMVVMSRKALVLMEEYYKIYRPKEYLFEGQLGGPYSIRSAQMVFNRFKREANVQIKGGIHCCGTVLRPIYWSKGRISAWCSSSWDTTV